MKSKKRTLLGAETIHQKKRSKQEDEQRSYGDGVAWLRGAMIGKGSYGCVFLGNLKKPKSKYSSYPPIMAVKSAEVSVSGSVQKEKEVMDNIRGCPNVIKCFGEEITNGENGQMVYNLLLEYGSGGTLAELLKKSSKGLPELEVKRYARSILHGLAQIHKRGYVHCDLKPENVLLVSNSRNGFTAKIGDLGLAKRSNQTKLGPYWRGTPMYLSPEAVINGVQEAPADVWAVGCIVLEMLTGKPVWFSKQDLGVDEILSRIVDEGESPCVSSRISREGKSFLKGCLCRKVMSRLTATMLLDHPFLKGLVEDDAISSEVEESQHEVVDINTITSSPVFSDSDNDEPEPETEPEPEPEPEEELWVSSYSDRLSFSEAELSSWSVEDEENSDASLHRVQQYPVTLTISKGV